VTILIVGTIFTNVVIVGENLVNVPDVALTTLIDKTIFGIVTIVKKTLGRQAVVDNYQF